MIKVDEAVAFMLRNATDPEEAARLADRLGPGMLLVSPGTFYPGRWVAAKQKSKVDIAIYAIRFCTDADALEKIAKSDKRLAVLETLRANKYLNADTKTLVAGRIAAWGEAPVKISETAFEKELSKTKASIRSAEKLSKIETLMKRAPDIVQSVDWVVDGYAKSESLWALTSFLYSLSGVQRKGCYYSFWHSSSKSAADVVGSLDVATQRELLKTFLYSVTYSSWAGDGVRSVDVELTKLIMEVVDASYITDINVNGYRVKEIFSQEAVELLLSDPAWYGVLRYQKLTPEQMSRLIDGTLDNKTSLLNLVHGDIDCAYAVIGGLSEDVVIEADDGVDEVLKCIRDKDNDLFRWLVKHASAGLILGYLTGSWSNYTSSFLPEIDEVEELSHRVYGEGSRLDIEYIESVVAQRVRSHGAADSMELLCAVARYVPGALGPVLNSRNGAKYVHEVLSATGAGTDLVIDQLASATPGTTLDEMCRFLTALVSVSSRN